MAKISDAFSLIRNGANIKQGLDDSGYPITRIETISNRTVDRNKMGYAGVTDLSKYADYVLQDGDILMSHINSETHLGKVAHYEKQGEETIIHGMNLLCLRPKSELIDSRFAFYFLSSEAFLRQIPRITKKSVNQASFNVAALKELSISIPAFDIQLQAVWALDKVSELITLRKEQLAKLDQLVKSRFVEMFGDPILNPMHWTIDTAEHHIDLLSGYPFDSTGYVDAGVHICGGLIIMPQRINWNECKYWKSTDGFETYMLAEDDIVMAMDRPWISEGFKIAQIDKAHLPALLIQRTARIRAVDLDQSYLFHYFLHGGFDTHCNVTGSLVPHISAKDIRSFKIMLPPIGLQNEFAAFVEQANKSKLTIQASLDKLKLLKKSLMQQYFG